MIRYSDYIKIRNNIMQTLNILNYKVSVLYVSKNFYDTFKKVSIYYKYLQRKHSIKIEPDMNMKLYEFGFTKKSELMQTINDLYYDKVQKNN